MRGDHERAQELLAGNALHALTDSDRREAARLLSTHVPGCEVCRLTQESFALVAGDLALAPRWIDPPRILLSRLQRYRRDRWGSRRPARLTAAAVALAMVGGLAAWNTHLVAQMARAERARALEGEVIATVTQPQSQVVPLTPSGTDVAGSNVVAAFVPGKSRLYLFGSLPALPHHRVYHVWLKRDGTYSSGGTFRPDAGNVYVRVEADPSDVDAVVVTEEPPGGHRSAPHQGQGVLTGDL
jgi:hypothetical protein